MRGYSSVAEHLLSLLKALGLSSAQKRKRKMEREVQMLPPAFLESLRPTLSCFSNFYKAIIISADASSRGFLSLLNKRPS